MRRLVLWTALLLTPFTASAFGGIDRGNGTDYQELESAAAWFTGAQNQIRYCLQIDPEFPLGEKDLDRNIQAAFRAWKDYDAEKMLRADLPFQGVKVDSCASADLTFHFVERFPGAPARVAYAQRVSYDIERGWGKGEIWLAEYGWGNSRPGIPDWTRGTRMKAVLVHELGHVFGVPHIEETIMAADLALTLFLPNIDLLRIDGRRQLVRGSAPVPGVLALPAEPAKKSFHACRDESAELFQLLTGRAPKGAIRAEFSAVRPATLSVTDDDGTYTFKLNFAAGGADNVATFEADLFYIAQIAKGRPIGKSFGKHISGVRYGTLLTSRGETLNVIWERNMSSSLQRTSVSYNVTGDVLKWFSPQGPRLLFTTSYQITTETSDEDYSSTGENTCLQP